MVNRRAEIVARDSVDRIDRGNGLALCVAWRGGAHTRRHVNCRVSFTGDRFERLLVPVGANTPSYRRGSLLPFPLPLLTGDAIQFPRDRQRPRNYKFKSRRFTGRRAVSRKPNFFSPKCATCESSADVIRRPFPPKRGREGKKKKKKKTRFAEETNVTIDWSVSIHGGKRGRVEKVEKW